MQDKVQSRTAHITNRKFSAIRGECVAIFERGEYSKTPEKDGQGKYVYENGEQKFTNRTDGPYTGTGQATLNVASGKFKVRLEPDDKCNETATNKRSRTRFGLGETGDIIVEPENPGDTVVFVGSSSSATDICTVKDQQFTLKNKPGSATITVKAKVNGASTPDTETCGITAIAPTHMVGISKTNWPDFHFNLFNANNLVGVGMAVEVRLYPKDVSFEKSILGEGYAEGMLNGKVAKHEKNVWGSKRGNDVMKGTLKIDGVGALRDPLDMPAETLVWNIAFGYYDLSNNLPKVEDNPLIPITVNQQIYIYDGKGRCTVTKFGMKATRVPNDILLFLIAVHKKIEYTGGWKFTD